MEQDVKEILDAYSKLSDSEKSEVLAYIDKLVDAKRDRREERKKSEAVIAL